MLDIMECGAELIVRKLYVVAKMKRGRSRVGKSREVEQLRCGQRINASHDPTCMLMSHGGGVLVWSDMPSAASQGETNPSAATGTAIKL